MFLRFVRRKRANVHHPLEDSLDQMIKLSQTLQEIDVCVLIVRVRTFSDYKDFIFRPSWFRRAKGLVEFREIDSCGHDFCTDFQLHVLGVGKPGIVEGPTR